MFAVVFLEEVSGVLHESLHLAAEQHLRHDVVVIVQVFGVGRVSHCHAQATAGHSTLYLHLDRRIGVGLLLA